MVVGKSPGESGRSCRLEGALAVRGHEVFNLICLDTPVEMKACEVRGRGGGLQGRSFLCNGSTRSGFVWL